MATYDNQLSQARGGNWTGPREDSEPLLAILPHIPPFLAAVVYHN